MMKRMFGIVVVVLSWILICPISVLGADSTPIPLPAPQMEGGKPLMQALKDRKSSRAFSDEALSTQTLSNLLWAAFGINRPESGKRTAPSAMNWQEVDVYVVKADGAYLYDAKANTLVPVVEEDLRGKTGGQPFVRQAPVNLVFVADLSKTNKREMPEADKNLFLGSHAGYISQNVYLFCASEGLATVVRGGLDKEALAKAMNLRPDQRITLAQTVGYPKK